MPIYEFVCGKCGHKFEVFGTYSYTEKCPKCSQPAEIVFSVPAKRDPNYGIQR